MQERRGLTIAFAVGFVVFLAVFMLVNNAGAQEEGESAVLKTGKNYLNINEEMLVSDFVRQNPQVDTISYFDVELNKTIGYVNVFGGMGKNFILSNNVEYEIIVKNETIINL